MRILYQYRHNGGGGINNRRGTGSPIKLVVGAITSIATVTLTIAGILTELVLEVSMTILLITVIVSVIAKLNRK